MGHDVDAGAGEQAKLHETQEGGGDQPRPPHHQVSERSGRSFRRGRTWKGGEERGPASVLHCRRTWTRCGCPTDSRRPHLLWPLPSTAGARTWTARSRYKRKEKKKTTRNPRRWWRSTPT